MLERALSAELVDAKPTQRFETIVSAYHVYAGTQLDALRRIRRVADAAAPAKPQAPFKSAGAIIAGNPGTQFGAGVTESEFILECTDAGSTQGVDGYVIKLPDDVGDGFQKVTASSASALHDLDLQFYNEDCSENVGDVATEAPDEEGSVPKNAAWLVVNLWDGAQVPFDVVVSRPAAGAAMRTVLPGAGENRPLYVRVAAVDRKGVEGAASDLASIRSTSFDRGIEVSTDGVSWSPVPSSTATGRFSIAGTTVARAAGITKAGAHMLWVRARAGDTVTKPVRVRVVTSGVLGTKLEPGLPATGVARYGTIAIALLLAGAAVGLYLRRAR